MRIAIDARYVQDHFPGIGRYTYNLIGGLAGLATDDTLIVVHNPRLTNTRYDLAALARAGRVELAETAAATVSLAEQWQLPPLARRVQADVWHAPYYIGPYRMPCPLVVTVHDAISSRYPQYLPSLAARVTYEAAMRLALAAAGRVIAVSEASRADVRRFFAAPAARLRVVHEAADTRYAPQPPAAVAGLRRRLALPARYLLYLGMNKPHKNLARLVEAWARVPPELRQTVQLVIAGRADPRYTQAEETVARYGVAESVRFLGDVAEADLPALYSGALLFVFPSLYEGFGLPVLEAMACGAPVLCSTTPALLEIVGDAAVTVDPLDVAALAQAMARLLGDAAARQELAGRGLAQARQFSWQRAAVETMAVYRELRHGS